MARSKTKFNIGWLKKKDVNGHLLEWWCDAHESDMFKAVCKSSSKQWLPCSFATCREKAIRKNQ